MTESHPWCSDPARDAAVRAAEDTAAKPTLPDHREFPERVAALEADSRDLRRRVELMAAICELRAISEERRRDRSSCRVDNLPLAPASRPTVTHQTHSTPGEVSAVAWLCRDYCDDPKEVVYCSLCPDEHSAVSVTAAQGYALPPIPVFARPQPLLTAEEREGEAR